MPVLTRPRKLTRMSRPPGLIRPVGSATLPFAASGATNSDNDLTTQLVASEGGGVGDLLVYFETNDFGDPSTPAKLTGLGSSSGSAPELYIGYRFLTQADLTDATVITSFSGQPDRSGVWLVVKGAGTPALRSSFAGNDNLFGFANATGVTVGSLVLASVHLDDVAVDDADWDDPSATGWLKVLGAPSTTGTTQISSTYAAYKIATASTENPGDVWAGGASDQYITAIIEVPFI